MPLLLLLAHKIKKIPNTINGDNMDYSEAINIIPRSLISLIVLFFTTKIIGKKQVSELSLFDYVIGISIGNFTAEMVMDIQGQYINGIIAMLTFGIFAYFVSIISMKSILLRRYIIGVPTLIIENGKILENAMKKTKIDINDLLEQTRNAGYFDIDEIAYAIMEANGKLSFLPKDKNKPITKKDMSLKQEKDELTANIIIDGKLMKNNIKNTDKSLEWVIHDLKVKGYKTYENILLATYKNNEIIVYEKNINKKPTDILE